MLWVANFRFRLYETCVKNHWGHKTLRSLLMTPTLATQVRLPLRLNAYLLSNSDIVKSEKNE